MTSDPRQHPLRCQCGQCTLPFGYIQNGALVIVSRHSGELHTNILPLAKVREMIEEATGARQ